MSELETLNDLNYEIISYVYELDEVQNVIKGFLVDKELTPENEVFLSEIGEQHIKLCAKLKVLLECYFNEEQLAGIPTSFSYRRLYKQLLKV